MALRRSRFRFSLRSLLLAVAGCALALAFISWHLERSRRQQAAATALRALGARVAYRYEADDHNSSATTPTGQAAPGGSHPKWLLSPVVLVDYGPLLSLGCSMTPSRASSYSDKDLVHLHKLPDLEYLRISGDISDRGVAVVGDLSALTDLTIESNRLGDRGVEQLRGLPNLERLLLWGEITDDGFKALGNIHTLTDLDVGYVCLTDKGLKHLRPLARLQRLSICGDIGRCNLADLSGFSNLRELDLSATDSISDAMLASIAGLRQLEWVALDADWISPAVTEYFGKLKELRFLSISCRNAAELTERDWRALRAVRELAFLGVGTAKVDFDELQAALPRTKVRLR